MFNMLHTVSAAIKRKMKVRWFLVIEKFPCKSWVPNPYFYVNYSNMISWRVSHDVGSILRKNVDSLVFTITRVYM